MSEFTHFTNELAHSVGLGQLTELSESDQTKINLILAEARERALEAHPTETDGDVLGFAALQYANIVRELDEQNERRAA